MPQIVQHLLCVEYRTNGGTIVTIVSTTMGTTWTICDTMSQCATGSWLLHWSCLTLCHSMLQMIRTFLTGITSLTICVHCATNRSNFLGLYVQYVTWVGQLTASPHVLNVPQIIVNFAPPVYKYGINRIFCFHMENYKPMFWASSSFSLCFFDLDLNKLKWAMSFLEFDPFKPCGTPQAPRHSMPDTGTAS